VAVELEERRDDGVLARHALNTRDGVARLQHGAVPPVGVVEGLLALVGADHGVVALKGTVGSVELIGRAITLALDTDGVTQVVSLLTVSM
jgi:hypothetical protein